MKNTGQCANQLLSSSSYSQHMIWSSTKMTGLYSRGRIEEVEDRRPEVRAADLASTTVD